MALATCKFIWLRHFLQELRFGKDEQMKLICDNQAALHMTSNPIFHEMTKHIEVDCHFIREKIALGCMTTNFVNWSDQLVDMFTKSLRCPRIKYICNKLDAFDLYAPAWGRVLRIKEYSLHILWFISYLFCTLFFFLLHFILFLFCSIILYIYRCLYTM